MAEFAFENQSSSKKKSNKTPKWLPWAVGGAGLAVIALLLSNKKSEDARMYVTDGYPDNSVDTQAQLQNFSDIMAGTTESMLNSYYADMQSYLTTTTNDLTTSINEQLNQIRQEQNAINAKIENDDAASSNTGLGTLSTFTTGTWSDWKSASNALNYTQKYITPNAEIVREDGYYKVVGNASNVDYANKALNMLKNANIISVGYVSPASREIGGSLTQYIPNYTFSTGTYANYNDAAKALNFVQENVGSSAHIVREGLRYKVIGSADTELSAQQAVSAIKKAGLASVGYVE